MELEILRFVHFVTVLALVMAAVFFLIGIARVDWTNILYTFINGFIVVMVANVPEGLPATVMSLLTIVGRRLQQKQIFVKKLNIIETLGSCTLIATDKTGTLTRNQMTVTALWHEGQFVWENFTQSDNGFTQDKILYPESCFQKMLRLNCVCNHASIRNDPDAEDDAKKGSNTNSQIGVVGNNEEREFEYKYRSDRATKLKIVGNASDIALLRFCECFVPTDRVRKEFPLVFEIPFSSVFKW